MLLRYFGAPAEYLGQQLVELPELPLHRASARTAPSSCLLPGPPRGRRAFFLAERGSGNAVSVQPCSSYNQLAFHWPHAGLKAGTIRSMYGLCTFRLDGFLQHKDDGNTAEAHQRHVAEVVDVGPEACLDRKLAAN